ncbi:hypothetical protein [Paenimyroides aestuarii]|uniref:Uncharacterized protein n=1 Tax=Paenimyroides aestuarii TaxID=2968490 RepID=A0ABY5NUS3_9FLAO|nr:hypothetical protein [Paenimyroides aestuarii]UUV22314.1 hypothetical protein NPX36_04565 [Paenimyroides aestuarii]
MAHKKIYLYIKLIALLLFLFQGKNLLAQVQNKQAFGLRTSPNSPNGAPAGGIYNLRGDFLMIGNANLYDRRLWNSGTPEENNSNNSNMRFYKLSGDPSNILNSSSAVLAHPSGFSQNCSKIVYAGLYWSGRGNNNSNLTLGNGLVKNKVKLKLPGETTYTELTANGIHFGDSDVDGIYTAYADITQQVRNLTNAWGTYSVADVATTVGDGGAVGNYGGWGMVVIYENAQMKWRDITMFDGFSYIAQANTGVTDYGELTVSGFRAAQNGNINVKMGMMAGEGDRGISGDVFDIRNAANSNWVRLSHSDNSPNNFFNSSVNTGENTRTPNYTNNYGLDIAMFDLPNSSKNIITNNQTSTRFRFGTNQDTYAIYSIVFAVDAYVPEVVAENAPAVNTPPTNTTVNPGQDLDFEVKLYNKGTEAINNFKVEIPIPFNLHYDSATIIPGTDSTIKISNNTTVTWQKPAWAPVGATPQNYPGGTLIWDVGTLPLDTSMAILQGSLKYKLKTTSNCAFLSTVGPCGLSIHVNGTVSGVGATSGTTVTSRLVSSYSIGSCEGADYDDFVSTINVSQAFIQSCAPPPVENGMLQFKAFCSLPGNAFPRTDITNRYPLGTKFFTVIPTSYDQTTNLVTGNFPVNTDGTKRTFYAVVPGMAPNCYISLQTSLQLVTTQPTVQNVSTCQGKAPVLQNALSSTGITNSYQLYYFDSATATTPLASTPNPSAVGTYTYWVAEGTSVSGTLCVGPKVSFTITVNALPTVAQNVPNISICENNDTQITVAVANATTYTWEYASASAPTVWNVLTNATFSGVVSVSNNTLNITHASNALNGTKVRLKVLNNVNCENISNEVSIQIKNCIAITNPMLPNTHNK